MSAHFGERLGLILQERGIRPSKITRDLGISRQSLYNWLGGRNISAMNVGRLADYLGVDRLWLIEGVGSPNGMHDGEGVYGAQARALIENVVNNEIRLKLATRAAGLAIWEYDVFRDRLSWAGESNPLCQINQISAYPDLNSFIGALAEPGRERFSKRLKLQLHEGGQGFEELAIHLPDGCVRNIAIWLTTNEDAAGRPQGVTGAIQDITDRVESQKALTESEAQLRKAQEIAVLGKWELDVESRHCALCNSAMEIFGFSEGGDHSPDLMYNQIHPEDRDCWEQSFNAAISGLEDYDVHYRIVKPHGDIRHISAKAELVRDNNGRPTSMFGIVQDVTEQQRRERKLGRLNRTYEMLSRCNKSLIRAQSEEQLLNEFCDHIVATGGYRVAWVGCAKNDEEKTVEPVAVAGDSIGYVRKAQLTWADTPRGQGPGGRAIRTGKPVIIRDVRTDELFQPWREVAIAQGYRSVTAFPLTANGNACGALFIYAEDTDAFDSEEVQLLENLAEDLSYGVHALRARRRRNEAEAELEESEQRFKDFAASASDWFWESGPDLQFTFLSEHFSDSTGVSPELIIGKRCEELTAFDPNDADWRRHLQELKERRPFKDFQFWHLTEDERRICSRMSGIPIFDDKGVFLGYRGTAADVTAQVNAQEELRLAAAVFESTAEGVMVVTVDGTILAINKAFTTITGYNEDEALGQKPSLLRSERHDSAFYATMWSAIHKDGHWSGEVWNRRKNGEVYPEWLNISSVKGELGEVSRYVAVFSDITAMKQSEERLFR